MSEQKTSTQADGGVVDAVAASDAGPADAAPFTSGPSGPGQNGAAQAAPAPDVARVIEETVAQTLSTLGITREMAQQQRADLERLVAPLAHAPEDIKSRLDSVCTMLIERVEDPKGLVQYNRQRRLFLDLLALHDLIRDLETGVEAADPDSPHAANYRNLNEQLLQLLAMNGVTPIVSAVGAPFSAQQHRVVRVVQTDEANEDGCIDSIVRHGFAYGTFIVRPTEVVVKKRSRIEKAAGVAE